MAIPDQTSENAYGETFQQALITYDYIFFTDDGDGIIMYYRNEPRRRALGGYGAEEILLEVILKRQWGWASEDMKYNIQCILEADSDQGGP